MKQELTNIPATIVDPTEKNQFLGELHRCIQTLQSAVLALREIPDFIAPSSASVDDWENALEAAGKRKETALEAIEKDVILTEDAKRDIARKWKVWHKHIATHCHTITHCLSAWPQAKWRWDDIVKNIVPGRNTIGITDERATRNVPTQANEHAKLIEDVREAVNALRSWEDEKDVERIPLERLLRMSSEDFALMWAAGNIIINHRYDHHGAATARNIRYSLTI